MQSPINSIYSFYLSSNVSRLANKLTPEQKKAVNANDLFQATTTTYQLRPMFLVQLANVLNGQLPNEFVRLINPVYQILLAIQEKATSMSILNGTELTLLAHNSKIYLQSTPKVFVPKGQPRPERVLPVTVDDSELQDLITKYVHMVYPTFLVNMVHSAITTLEQHGLLNDPSVIHTSLRNMVLFNLASGINVTKQAYDELVLPGVKSNINLFYLSNFHPTKRDEDLTLATLALIRYHVIMTPQTYRHVLNTPETIIGSCTFMSGRQGGLLKADIEPSKLKISNQLYSSTPAKNSNLPDRTDYSELILESNDDVTPLSKSIFPPPVNNEDAGSDSDNGFSFDGK